MVCGMLALFTSNSLTVIETNGMIPLSGAYTFTASNMVVRFFFVTTLAGAIWIVGSAILVLVLYIVSHLLDQYAFLVLLKFC